MKELVLIPCCGEKDPGGKTEVGDRKIENELSKENRLDLLQLRKKVAESFGINLGKREYKLAYKRYIGNLYSEVSNDAWVSLEEKDNTELVIISALYGLIYWDQPIINYDVEITDKIKPKRTLKTWWKNNDLSLILADFIENKNFDVVGSLLSNNYEKAICGAEKHTSSTWLFYSFTGLGSGSNYYRGRDLTQLLLAGPKKCKLCGSSLTKRLDKSHFKCISCNEEFLV